MPVKSSTALRTDYANPLNWHTNRPNRCTSQKTARAIRRHGFGSLRNARRGALPQTASVCCRTTAHIGRENPFAWWCREDAAECPINWQVRRFAPCVERPAWDRQRAAQNGSVAANRVAEKLTAPLRRFVPVSEDHLPAVQSMRGSLRGSSMRNCIGELILFRVFQKLWTHKILLELLER